MTKRKGGNKFEMTSMKGKQITEI